MKTRNLILLLAAAACVACTSSQDEKHPQPFGLESVTLTSSWVKERMQLNTDYLHRLDPDRLLHNFRVNAGIPSDAVPLEGWEAPWIGLRGHFTGHYLSAASMLVKAEGDTLLAARLSYMVDALEECQLALGDKGNLSAFPERDFDHVETYFTGVWAPYYTYNKVMQGLLHTYQYTGNEKAYRMVLRMADYVWWRMQRLDEASRKRMLLMLGANPQNEVGAMNEVLYALYGMSGDPKHRELARMFEPEWLMRTMLAHEDVLSGLHANTHIVLVNGYAKAYEVTGEENYRVAVENFWDILHDGHVYANGSSSGPRPNRTTSTSLTAEHWGLSGQLASTLTGEIAESCVTHNTQKLSSALFSWSGDARYADAYMNTWYNSVMALQSAHTGRCTYHLPLGSPRHKHWLAENDFRCCNGSSIEAFATLHSSIYFHDASTLWVNMYVPSTLHWSEGPTLSQSGNFPFSPQVTITIDEAAGGEHTINLFVPSWAEKVTVSVNGKDMGATTPMSYKQLRRVWQPGDSIVLDFTYDFHFKPVPGDEHTLAFFYGPMLLAFDSGEEIVLKGTPDEVLSGLRVGDDGNCYLDNAGRTLRLIPLMQVENQAYSVYATINNCYF